MYGPSKISLLKLENDLHKYLKQTSSLSSAIKYCFINLSIIWSDRKPIFFRWTGGQTCSS